MRVINQRPDPVTLVYTLLHKPPGEYIFVTRGTDTDVAPNIDTDWYEKTDSFPYYKHGENLELLDPNKTLHEQFRDGIKYISLEKDRLRLNDD